MKRRFIMIAGICLLVIALAVVGIVIFIPKEEKLIPLNEIIHDKEGCKIEYRSNFYIIEIDYDNKFSISSFRVREENTGKYSNNILAPERGVYLTLSTSRDGNEQPVTESSLILESSPEVEIQGNKLTFVFETENVKYTAILELEDLKVNTTFERLFKNDSMIEKQGFPSVNLEEKAIENIRWNRSGSNFWVGGKAENFTNFLAAGEGYSESNVVRGMEDIDFTLLSENIAVAFKGEVPDRDNQRPYLTQVQRYEDGSKKHLEMNISISRPDRYLVYSSGTSDGWPTGPGGYGGRVGAQGTDLVKEYKVLKDQKDTVEFEIIAQSFNSYYDLGELKGVDEMLLSYSLNNYGRLMIMDWNMGTTVENPNVFFEIPALQQHWNTGIIGILGDDNALESQKNGLRNIKNRLQARDGHIASPYVGMGLADSWGSGYSDTQLGYVIAICMMYDLTGDNAFFAEMFESARMAMEYTLETYVDKEVWVIKNLADWDFVSKFDIPSNDYWEHSGGKYNGYTTAMYYDALVRMADLSEYVMKDTELASYYRDISVKVKDAFNEVFWSEETQTFLYGTGTKDIAYLPVQGAAMKTDLVSSDRKKLIVSTIERENSVFNLPFHVMNVRDILNPYNAVPQVNDFGTTMMGMNGGWYGAPDGDYYSGLPVYGDRTLIPRYINGYTELFSRTGFIGASTYFRDGVTPADYGWMDCMPTFANVVWGLYTYGYGFQPSFDKLVIAPFIDNTMEGSLVKYRWRTIDLTVTYDTIYSYKIDIPSLPTDIYVKFINQTPGKEYSVKINGEVLKVVADDEGNIFVKITQSGVTSVELTDPDREDVTNGENIALGKPVSSSSSAYIDSISYWPVQVTDGYTEGNSPNSIYSGFWEPEEEDKDKWLCIATGKKYDVSEIRINLYNEGKYYFVIEGCDSPLLDKWTTMADHRKKGMETDDKGWLDVSVKEGFTYIRIRFTEKGAGDNLKVCEISVK